MSGYYRTDPDDLAAPVELTEYQGIRPGDQVADAGPVAPLPGPLTVTAIYEFRDRGSGGWVTAILNAGKYEVNADQLRRLDAADSKEG